MSTEIIPDLSFADYLAHDSYGSSDLRAFRFGPPAMVPWQRANRQDHTDATLLGAAAHCRILTPELFGRTYIAKPPGMTFASTIGKAWRAEKLNDGFVLDNIMSSSEWQDVEAIADAFRNKEAAFASLDNVEHSVFWTGPHGLPLKARPDWFDHRAIYDLKVSIDATKSLHTLRYKAFANGWLGQLAHGRAGLNANGCKIKVGRLVVIAPKPPQGLRVWLLEVAENDMDVLNLENENTERDMVVCHRSGVWPGTPDDWQKCPLPADHMMADLEDLEAAEEVANVDE